VPQREHAEFAADGGGVVAAEVVGQDDVVDNVMRNFGIRPA
jgi:hypothetical protein